MQINESTEHLKFAEKVQNKHGKRVRNYQEKIDSALRKLKEKGINIHLEITKIMVAGIARQGYTGAGDHEIGKLYDELRKEIDACERAKGATRPLLNIARDATIAVSSLDHDFLITCDKCLYKSWHRTIGNHGMLGQRFKVPKIILTERHPKAVANAILNVLS